MNGGPDRLESIMASAMDAMAGQRQDAVGLTRAGEGGAATGSGAGNHRALGQHGSMQLYVHTIILCIQ